MPLDARVYAADVIDAIALIERFTQNLDFETYISDVMRISAVERQLSIVGEAVTQLSKLETKIVISHAKQIIGFRNILIHNYARVSQAVIWTIVVDALPTLKIECLKILEPH
jgi:uncharacterized protein with HEPN domain